MVIQMEVIDVAGVVVVVHNVPGEDDVRAVPVSYLEVVDVIILGDCITTNSKKKKRANLSV